MVETAPGALAPMNSGGDLPETQQGDLNTTSQATRELAEVRGMMLLARHFPRDTTQARADLNRLCESGRFAEDGFWTYPRGGKTLTGPSVHLARAAAAAWQNIRFGKRFLRDDGENVLLEGYAWDLQTNAYVTDQAEFKCLIQRKQKVGRDPETGADQYETKWVKPDERDKRELVNRHGAILIRNCILQIIPRDVTDQAFEICLKTAKSGGGKSRDEQIAGILGACAEIGVKKENLERWLAVTRAGDEVIDADRKDALESISPEELATLRGAYKSIVDGNSKVSDFFDVGSRRPTASAGTLNMDMAAGDPATHAGHQNAPKPGDRKSNGR